MVIKISPEEKIKIKTRNVKNTLKEKLNRNLQAAWDSTEEFCLNSGIGGLRYCADRSRHWFERTWWFFVVALSFSVCAYLIAELWENRSKYPITVVYDGKITTIRSVPFPAITLCPPVRIAADAFNWTDFIEKYKPNWPTSLGKVPLEEKERLKAALQLCSQRIRETFPLTEAGNKTHDIYGYINKIALKRSTILKSCAWVGEDFDFDLFNIFITEGGPCLTFNMLNSRSIYTNITTFQLLTVTDNPDEGDWNLEKELIKIGEPRESHQKTSLPLYPHYITRLDDIDSLTLILNFNFQNYHWNFECLRPTTTSYKVFIHRPDEVKRAFDRPLEIEIGKKTALYISPKVVTASHAVRKYAPRLRRCIFSTERQLKYYKTYTRNNCENECLVNFIEKECGCVKFAMPREESTKVCDVNQLECCASAVQKHREKRSMTNRYKSEENDECNCLPTCVDVNYEAEVSELQYVDGNMNVNSNTSIVSTLLTISFKDNEFLALKREEMYTATGIVSTCGGLLSLFMGVSLLSIAEIVYHCTIGYGCKLSTRKSKKFNEKPTTYTY